MPEQPESTPRNRAGAIPPATERSRLSDDELAACQNDPTLAWTIRGPKRIACIEPGCGAVLEQLGQHLRNAHTLTAREYKRKPALDGVTPRYSLGASLLAIELRERLSKQRKKLQLGRRLHRSGKVPPVRKLIASRGRRVLSQQYRIEQGRRMKRARPELWGTFRGKKLKHRAEDWQIARLAADGIPDLQIAQAVGMKHGQSIGIRREKIGFRNFKKARVYEHGEVLTGRDLLVSYRELGKELQRVADELGLKYSTLERRLHRDRLDKPLPTKIGRVFKHERAKWREQFRHQAASASGGRPPLLFPSERERMRSEYERLLPAARSVLKWIANSIANEERIDLPMVIRWVYLQAREGKLRSLALWPELFGWIAEPAQRELLDQVLRGSLKPFLLAHELLAGAYGVKAETIRKAVQSS